MMTTCTMKVIDGGRAPAGEGGTAGPMREGWKGEGATTATEVVNLAFSETVVRLVRAVDLAAAIDARELLCGESPTEPPYWMHVWPAALALARAVAAERGVGPGRRVVEIGCGLGLPSLVAARRGASVVAADWKIEPLRLLRRSALLSEVSLSVVQLDWTDVPLRGGFDFCLMADVAYDSSAEAALVLALDQLLAPSGLAWLADSVNTHRRTLIERLTSAGFSVEADRWREEEEGRPVWVRVMRVERSRTAS
jgi:predicted nicotinamide N-methyase